ncbi:MAG: nuclear transport factor 2 family protein [Sphingobium sp.]
MDAIERLLALEEIRLLRARYSQAIDAKRWSDLENILSPDAVLDLSPAAETLLSAGRVQTAAITGRTQILLYLEDRFRHSTKRLHIATMPQIEFEGSTRAKGVWRQETYIGEAVPDHQGTGIAYGFVHDEYRKIDGIWLISSVKVTLDLIL